VSSGSQFTADFHGSAYVDACSLNIRSRSSGVSAIVAPQTVKRH
jgi:hypothetical protein